MQAAKPHTINFDKYTYQAGNKNWAIAQDTYGVMYFGNDNGLLEFDGVRWKLYTIPEAEVVRAVAITDDNRIFTGGFEEFGVWERNETNELVYTSLSKEIKQQGNLKNDDIWRIHVADDVVLFQSFNHIYVYDYERTFVRTEGSNILFLLQVYDEYWIQKTGGSLYRLVGERLDEIPGSSVFSDTEVRVVLPYAGHQYLVVTTTKGFYLYDGHVFTRWQLPTGMEKYQVNNGILSSNGNYFFGTILNGIYEMTPGGTVVNHFSTNNFLQNNTVLGLFEDEFGNVWAALDRGISYLQYLNDLDCYIDPSGKTGAVYSAVLFDDKLFLATNQGLFYLPATQLAGLDPLSDMRLVEGTEGQVWDVKVYGDKLLCGHNYGLLIIDKQLRITESDEVSRGVYKINRERYNNTDLLFASTYFVASILKGDLSFLSNINDIREPIMDIEMDHLGNIWMTHTQKGLYRCRFMDNISRQKLIRMYGLNDRDDQPRRFRIFKLGGRVIFLSDDHFYIYDDIADKLIPFDAFNQCFEGVHSIQQLIPLGYNMFYALTNNSVYKGFYDGDEVYLIENFDMGFNHLSLVNAYENAVVLDDSTSMICLDNGFMLHHFRVKIQQETADIPPPYIRLVETRNMKDMRYYWQLDKEDIRIPYNQHTISFDFFSRNVMEENLLFQYRLRGEADEWSTPEKIHDVRFERLSKGDYVFELRTVNSLGEYSSATSFSFSILPPWYQTGWAYIVYVLCVILSLIGVWFIVLRRYRNVHLLKVRMREEQRLRRQNASLQQVIEEKDAELFSQASFIIQKNELILTVKKEIDDFYNSSSGKKVFLPLYSKIAALLNKNMDIDEDWKMFLIQFEQKHAGFFHRIREVHPDLTSNDLKLCACLRLNLSSKDISSLMNISLRAVENSRYRLRKKLDIPSTQNLNDYFMRF